MFGHHRSLLKWSVCIERGERRSATADFLLMPPQASRLSLFPTSLLTLASRRFSLAPEGAVCGCRRRGGGLRWGGAAGVELRERKWGPDLEGADASRVTPGAGLRGTRRRGPSVRPPRGLSPRGERAPGERQAPPCERGSGIKARAVILAFGSAVLVDALRGDAGVDEHAITAVCPAALAFLDALGLPSSPPSPSAAASRCSASSRKPHREPGTTGSCATASSSSHRLAGSTLFWSPSCPGGGGPRRTFSRRSTSLPAGRCPWSP